MAEGVTTHDWRNYRTCQCGQPGCFSYRQAPPVADIIDEIDQLVDAQMAGGEPENGYDYDNPDYPKCPHCGRDFHGIPLTVRILEMRNITGWDDNYRVDTDDSPVVCEGSLFIGPIRAESIWIPEPYKPWVIYREQLPPPPPMLAPPSWLQNLYDLLLTLAQDMFAEIFGEAGLVIDARTWLGDIAFEFPTPNLPVLRPDYLPMPMHATEGYSQAGRTE
ncbi:hypothetical protein [Mycobacteroides abscessus]|uniref:hypothetical protein n=1 Tax=Mycobacteroides abscessus TaxID=36809 RepID=UPI0005DEC5C7|nr:hypothetical protein [Mycobacteroides abscessus]CPR79393.1 Uncharacterised protein [Mycobacteroides abscessus]CPR88520.1 Uncharacterised protein [Mycobacteroides abscessus]CPS43456.1 Uncharacterised protein [Mycobacteroides abscessus]CPV03253.1 Uncharacterised protein [Mycobacteroides abscessus]